MADSDEWTCERCDRTFHDLFDIMRNRSGEFVETLPDGSTKVYELVCEDCRDFVVRRA